MTNLFFISNELNYDTEDTAKIIDGFITITGRIKELIITAGGENVAPVLIEDQFKLAMTALSNCMVIGDERKFLSILLCIQVEIDDNGNPTDKLCGEALLISKAIGSEATTSTEASKCEKWKEYFNKVCNSSITMFIKIILNTFFLCSTNIGYGRS